MKKFFTWIVLLAALVWGVRHDWSRPSQFPISVLPCTNITQGCGSNFFVARFSEAPQVMKPLHLNVHLNHPETIRNVHVDFAMQNMEMGLNRYRLIQSKQLSDWQAEITLPVCIQGRSDWSMLIEFEADDDIQRFQIPFSAKPSRRK